MKFKSLIKLFMVMLSVSFCVGFTRVDATNAISMSETRLQLIEEGVDIDKVDILIEKLESGELLDSMKEEYSNISPVREFL